MNCLLALISVCLFDPSNLSVDAYASQIVSGDFHYYLPNGGRYHGSIGTLSITVDVPVTSTLEFRYGIAHRSYLETGSDRGEESAILGFTFRPFRR